MRLIPRDATRNGGATWDLARVEKTGKAAANGGINALAFQSGNVIAASNFLSLSKDGGDGIAGPE